jgi:hypothetical protein
VTKKVVGVFVRFRRFSHHGRPEEHADHHRQLGGQHPRQPAERNGTRFSISAAGRVTSQLKACSLSKALKLLVTA